MTDTTKFKLNYLAGQIELEGSEEFVKAQVSSLGELISIFKLMTTEVAVDESIVRRRKSHENQLPPDGSVQIPETFGEWMHSFRADVNDLDKALITARFVQSQSATDDFKTGGGQ